MDRFETMTIKKEDVNWDNYHIHIAGESEKKPLSEQDKDWFVQQLNLPQPDEDAEKAISQRGYRNSLLDASDWIVQRSSEKGEVVPDEWQTYRQALRDLPTHKNWPNLQDSDWPTKPS